ncbi:l-aspartate oxidase [Nannochloropsis oceanica]
MSFLAHRSLQQASKISSAAASRSNSRIYILAQRLGLTTLNSSSSSSSRGLHYQAALGSDADVARVVRERQTDLLVLGCGVAGCAAALKAAEQGLKVTMVTSATDPLDCNSFWAQGGIIYKATDDSPSLLSSDIMVAGAGVNDPLAVEKLAMKGPGCVEDLLLRLAPVPFDRKPDGGLALCLEASHNRARIIHWRDHTGRAITESLQQAAASHLNILLLSGMTAVDLAVTEDGGKVSRDSLANKQQQQRRCLGAHLMRVTPDATEPVALRAPATVLATGGLGELYQHTSNPASARGDGFAMAFRAGAALQNMEYVQFHPTTLHLPGERSFLLTEALRGEGARLINLEGEAFATRYHPQGELAPRDVVSRMIVSEMSRTGASHMLLDISHREKGWLRGRFPSIDAHCRARGLDMTRQALPVVPAAHYFCGGVVTDLEGQTSLPGLFAAGEVACTGLHGANRLASTSLLEGLVWGVAIAEQLKTARAGKDGEKAAIAISNMAQKAELAPLGHSVNGANQSLPAAKPEQVDAYMAEIRRTLWENVGVVRRPEGLEHASCYLRRIEAEVLRFYASTRLSKETVSLRNAAETARLIARAAARNTQSIGTHYVESDEGEEADEEEQERKLML